MTTPWVVPQMHCAWRTTTIAKPSNRKTLFHILPSHPTRKTATPEPVAAAVPSAGDDDADGDAALGDAPADDAGDGADLGDAVLESIM